MSNDLEDRLAVQDVMLHMHLRLTKKTMKGIERFSPKMLWWWVWARATSMASTNITLGGKKRLINTPIPSIC